MPKKEVTKPKRGRPFTEQGPTPDSVRSARSKEALIAAGGRKLSTNLSPEATQALEKIKTKRGHATDRAGVEDALHCLAKKL
jgi:hypothetical protein